MWRKLTNSSSIAAWLFCNATERFSQFSIFTQLYVLVDIVINIAWKMKIEVEQARTEIKARLIMLGIKRENLNKPRTKCWRSWRKWLHFKNLIMAKLIKNKNSWKKKLKKKCALLSKKSIFSKKGIILGLLFKLLLTPFNHQLWKMHRCSALLNVDAIQIYTFCDDKPSLGSSTKIFIFFKQFLELKVS